MGSDPDSSRRDATAQARGRNQGPDSNQPTANLVAETDPSAKPTRPSRAEIESLCLLYAAGATDAAGPAGTNSRSAGELAEVLGLSQDLAPLVAQAMDPLVDAGWAEERGDGFVVTEAGRSWMSERLEGFRAR